jgi:hypothetical protein
METKVQNNLTGSQVPDHKHLTFTLNAGTGYQEITKGEIGFQKVPNELKLVEIQQPNIVKSDFIIRGRVKEGKYSFFTGLLKTNFQNWYFGDFYETRHGIKRNSFILFLISPDQFHLEIFFFNHFKLYPKNRGHFVRNFIENLKK